MPRPALLFSLVCCIAACGNSAQGQVPEKFGEFGTVKQELALFDYIAANTDSATNQNNSATTWIHLSANESVMLGTCGINESAADGNTFLRLFSPEGIEVASNDDSSSPGCTLGSTLSFTAPSAGNYLLRAGCASSEECAGTVALSRSRGFYSFTAAETNDATEKTYNRQFKVVGGSVIRISTCATSSHGAFATGDTYLRLFQQTYGLYMEVAMNDNATDCGTASEIIYMAPTAGYYQVRAGCSGDANCSGQLAIYVE